MEGKAGAHVTVRSADPTLSSIQINFTYKTCVTTRMVSVKRREGRHQRNGPEFLANTSKEWDSEFSFACVFLFLFFAFIFVGRCHPQTLCSSTLFSNQVTSSCSQVLSHEAAGSEGSSDVGGLVRPHTASLHIHRQGLS